ncbi:MAG: RICIN domain-containing protein [Desulfococcaceae bacterium]
MPYLIRSMADDRVLQVDDASTENLALVEIAPATGAAHQSWYFVPEETLAGRVYSVFSLKSGRVLDVRGYSREVGAPVQQFAPYGSNNQRWRLLPDGEGAFRMRAVHSDQCLGLAPGASWPEGEVGQFPCGEVPGQRWRLAPNPSARKVHVLVARHSGMALDIRDGGLGPEDRNVIQRPRNGGLGQLWTLVPLGDDGEAPRYSVISYATGRCLDVSGNSEASGANVQQYPCHGGPNQQWRLEPIGDGAYRIVAVHSDFCLDVDGAATESGANVQQYPCHGGDNQAWRLIAAEARP